MINKIITAVLISTLSVSGFAANHVIFSCTNKQGKKVEVKEIGQNIQYSFGRPGNPELVFKNSKTQVAKQTKENPPPELSCGMDCFKKRRVYIYAKNVYRESK